jgi:hypothetical protein
VFSLISKSLSKSAGVSRTKKRRTDDHGNTTPSSTAATLPVIFASDEFLGEWTVLDLGVPGESDIAPRCLAITSGFMSSCRTKRNRLKWDLQKFDDRSRTGWPIAYASPLNGFEVAFGSNGSKFRSAIAIPTASGARRKSDRDCPSQVSFLEAFLLIA